MASLHNSLKQMTELALRDAKLLGVNRFCLPDWFDGSIEQYIRYLNYLKKRCKEEQIDLTVSFRGHINFRRI